LPTPTTNEFCRVVDKLAEAVPLDSLPRPIAPIAPEPLSPEGSTPAKDITVIEEVTADDKAALTVTLFRRVCENARQISAVPFCVLVRTTRTHVKSAPETLFTVVPISKAFPAPMKASNSSPVAVVENCGEVITEHAVV
jgi:hypothetical protein